MSRFKPRRFEAIVVAGMIVGLCFILLPVFQRTRDFKRGTACQSNLKRLGFASLQYIRDYDEKYPLKGHWREDLTPYTKTDSVFHCPARTVNGYAFNGYLIQQQFEQMGGLHGAPTIPMFFDSSLQHANATDQGQSWPKQKVHPQGNGIVFLDGHTSWLLAPPDFRSFATKAPS